VAVTLLSNSSLKTLNLSRNGIGNEGAFLLSRVLRANSTTSLTQLYLDENDITSEGAYFIAQALRTNSTLSLLDLACNNIGNEGTLSILQTLHVNSTLTHLDLSNVSITEDLVEILLLSLKASHLSFIGLVDNDITEASMDTILAVHYVHVDY